MAAGAVAVVPLLGKVQAHQSHGCKSSHPGTCRNKYLLPALHPANTSSLPGVAEAVVAAVVAAAVAAAVVEAAE